MVTDPVCNLEVDQTPFTGGSTYLGDDYLWLNTGEGVIRIATYYQYNGQTYFFCSRFCRDLFVKDPQHFINGNSVPHSS